VSVFDPRKEFLARHSAISFALTEIAFLNSLTNRLAQIERFIPSGEDNCMLPEEAVIIGRWACGLGLDKESVCLNVGSSTRTFREQTQPFIHASILKPLADSGARVINCDLKPDDGVDEIGDLLDPGTQRRLAKYEPDLIICSNLLEHLTDPAAFAQACAEIAKPGGHCIFTVPRSFPYHPDPLDTMYRPTPDEIAALLPSWKIVAATELAAGSYYEDLRATGTPGRSLLRQVIRVLLPFYRPGRWYPAVHQLLWLARPYKVSLVMLQKPLS
jgi:SAM-dependent methyltransferase